MMKLPKLTAVIEPGEDGWYVANCPELGIVSQGETPEHAEEMIKEAVELWLECADESEVRRRLDERKVAIKELEVTHALAARLFWLGVVQFLKRTRLRTRPAARESRHNASRPSFFSGSAASPTRPRHATRNYSSKRTFSVPL